MTTTSVLAQTISRHLPEEPGVVLLLGGLSLADGLHRDGSLVTILNRPLKKKDSLADRRLARAGYLDLPIAEQSVSSLVAVSVLSRLPSPAEALERWKAVLRHGGTLVVVERLIRSLTLRALHRLLSRPPHPLAPEELTSLLLNGGFGGITQSWPATRAPTFVTAGSLRLA